METGYTRHMKSKGLIGEFKYFLIYLWGYIKVSIKNHKENEGYGIELQVLDDDHPILTKSNKKFEIVKNYYDGPIWSIRFGFILLWVHL